MLTLADTLARLEGVRREGDYFVARCPAQDDRNPSLSIRARDDGRVLLKCFGGCDFGQIVAALKGGPVRLDQPVSELRPFGDEVQRSEVARRIWRESRNPRGTTVEKYLQVRCIRGSIPASIRFHPGLKHPCGRYFPTMVAAVQDRDGKVVAIHRTFLRPDGSGKADLDNPKMMLGPTAGGAVRFGPVAPTIYVAEGVETALSIARAMPEVSVWAALSIGGLRRMALPDPVREIVICADRDLNRAGEKAAHEAAGRFVAL